MCRVLAEHTIQTSWPIGITCVPRTICTLYTIGIIRTIREIGVSGICGIGVIGVFVRCVSFEQFVHSLVSVYFVHL